MKFSETATFLNLFLSPSVPFLLNQKHASETYGDLSFWKGKEENKNSFYLIEAIYMAKTKAGKKIVSVPPHKRTKSGGERKIKVRGHRRSTPG